MDNRSSKVGCSHYKRRAKFVTPCCDNVYYCRFCHDENENHKLNRKEVTTLLCTSCNNRQKVQEQCEVCNTRFGKYACLTCKLFDDEDKKQFHCDGCGICRIGGRENFFHCKICNLCLPMDIRGTHKCIENASRSDCPICLEDIHTSRISSHIPNCGHLLHRPCFEELLKSGHFACPTCQTSLVNMSELWNTLDNEVQMTPIPPEYSNLIVNILCRDCHEKSTVKFHFVGLKCSSCGSYNTCRTDDPPQQQPVTTERNVEESDAGKPARTTVNREEPQH
ncbi:UNVERIFIED_CONTAM: hypothetical protein PYX00_000595 [Menopon gallinae]|uniref:RING finger and CHY zinc finger domain-containing protein 1 n=1 Tax=Menopon gallinae TaxID=328185 RepID=A0AAW2I9N8_9NEOP